MAFDMGGLAAPVQLTKQNIDAYSTQYACAIGEIMTAAQWTSYHGRHRSLLMGLMGIHDTVGYIDRAGPIWTEEWRRLARDEDLKVPQEVDHGI